MQQNPAGLAHFSGIQPSFTTQRFGATVDFRNVASQATSGSTGGTIVIPPPTQLYLAATLGDFIGPWLTGLKGSACEIKSQGYRSLP